MPHLITAVVLLLGFQAEPLVGTGPEPAPTRVSWEFGLKYDDPQRIEVLLPGNDRSEVYWYMVYTVTNPDSRSQLFFPTFQIVTEDLQVIDTDVGISPLVFEAIRERHRKTHKYLVHPTPGIGELLSGDDNARECVAIWRQMDLNINSFKVYVSGLSGETLFIPNPVYDPDKPETVQRGPDGKERVVNPKHFTLRKTLEIKYQLPGSEASRSLAAPERDETRWIMR
ncbi:MAG: hypothetical protein ABIG44_12455 [Planctomycetota bacterium]